MAILRLLKALSQSGLLSIANVVELKRAVDQHGINLMVLLQFAAKKYGEQAAIIHNDHVTTFDQLFGQSMQLAQSLHEQYDIKPNMKIGFHCRNSVELVRAIFACSRLGVRMYFLNTEMASEQVEQLIAHQQFDLLLYDHSYTGKTNGVHVQELLQSVEHVQPLAKTSSSTLVLLTSGTTGAPKEVVHQPSLFHYLNPFIAMVERLQLNDYKSGYIATPIYHGYGLAILCLLVALGKKIVLQETFEAKAACALIRKHRVEMMSVVPLMVRKMLEADASSLVSLRCIASGGAVLSPTLVQQVEEQLGAVLYNLYGTSETGLNIIATPADLAAAPSTIGRGIDGIGFKIVEPNEQGIGKIAVKSEAGMQGAHDEWLSTGDLGYCDKSGRYFLVGRQDDLVVSGGVNVYPVQLEHALLEHPCIADVAVVGVKDEQFGQRLQAFVQLKRDEQLSEQELVDWLKSNVARYEMPKDIIFINEIPYTNIGKKDKKSLRALQLQDVKM